MTPSRRIAASATATLIPLADTHLDGVAAGAVVSVPPNIPAPSAPFHFYPIGPTRQPPFHGPAPRVPPVTTTA